MEILLSISMLLIGLGLLNYGSDWFILGNIRIARYFKLSNFVIGATVVALGTSLPETVTTLYSAYKGLPMIAVGNSLGSCIVNIGFVLGLCAVIYPIVVKQGVVKNSQIYLLYSLLLFILGYNGFCTVDGTLLLLLFLCYMVYTLKKRHTITEECSGRDIYVTLAVVFIVVGLVGILVGSKLFIDGAKNTAQFLGVPDRVIGFTLVAFGTSLPEVVVSISAIRRKLGDIVVGNVIGSNMVNIGCALALSSMIVYIPPTRYELFINLVLVVLMVLFMNRGRILGFLTDNNKYSKIGRVEGLILFLTYLIYLLSYSGV